MKPYNHAIQLSSRPVECRQECSKLNKKQRNSISEDPKKLLRLPIEQRASAVSEVSAKQKSETEEDDKKRSQDLMWPQRYLEWNRGTLGWGRGPLGWDRGPLGWDRGPLGYHGLGYLRDFPDPRDFDLEKNKFREALEEQEILINHKSFLLHGPSKDKKGSLRPVVDFREGKAGTCLSGVHDQGPLGACTAHAVSTQIEFLMRSKDKNKSQLSRLFLYKATRRLLGWTGDTGAYIRSTIKAMRVFGAPPEEYYPYNIESFDEEPKAFSYAFADDYRATSYARLDILDSLRSELLDLIKRALADGLPVTFGFTVFASLTDDPYVPMPGEDDKAIGGHAVCAIGYDDDFKVLIFQNSWGLDWGENGFGYLPFAYVEKGLANDFWVVTQTNAENMRLFD